jgi:hypothetical protein
VLGVLVLAIQRFGVVSVAEEILINHNVEEHGVKAGYDLQRQRTPYRRGFLFYLRFCLYKPFTKGSRFGKLAHDV